MTRYLYLLNLESKDAFTCSSIMLYKQVMKDCIEAFNEKDSICEPSIFKTVKKYFNAGGTPEEVM